MTISSALATQFDERPLEGAVDPKTAGSLTLDSEGNGQTDLLVWSKLGVRLYRHGTDLVADSGLGSVAGVISVAAGDYDNDGLMDLCILTETGPLLYHNTKGRFAPVETNFPRRRFDAAVWIDYDHDYDLDLILLVKHLPLCGIRAAPDSPIAPPIFRSSARNR